jgi:hypothetical protein
MNVLLKVAISLVLLALLVSAVLSVLTSLLSRVTTDSFPRLSDPDGGEPDYDRLGARADGRD